MSEFVRGGFQVAIYPTNESAETDAVLCTPTLSCESRSVDIEESVMGKYFIAWLLGVPAFVLVLLYILLN
jgi:hypothetical protein